VAKKRDKEPQTAPAVRNPENQNPTVQGDPRRRKALILGALTAGGVFQMNSWQAQACGNRSSHCVATFQTPYFSPNDYVLMRQTLTAPDANQTRELADVTANLNTLRSRASVAADANTQELASRKTALENDLKLRASSARALDFIRQGDTAGAVAAIEGQGWPDRVLGEYLWAFLDIAYLNGQGTSDGNVKNFVAIAKPALAYCDKLLTALEAQPSTVQNRAAKERIAEIEHNVASFTILPATVSAEDLQMATTAAERALKIRTELAQPPQVMRAKWMVGQCYLKAGKLADAQRQFQQSLAEATKLKDGSGIAWSKYSLALAMKTSNPAQATRYQSDARQFAENFRGKDSTVDFLKIELAAQQ